MRTVYTGMSTNNNYLDNIELFFDSGIFTKKIHDNVAVYNIVNHSDLVPSLPPTWLGFETMGFNGVNNHVNVVLDNPSCSLPDSLCFIQNHT
jgi:predicted lipase